MMRRILPSEISKKLRTSCGSNCVPLLRVNSARACAAGSGFLYERAAVITS